MSIPDTDFHSPNAQLQLHIGDVADAERSSIMHATKFISTACSSLQTQSYTAIQILTESTKEPYMQNKIIQLKEALHWGRPVTASIT